MRKTNSCPQVRLEDVVGQTLWDESRFRNASMQTSPVDLSGGFISNMGEANLKATSPIAFTTAMLSLAMLVGRC